MQNLLSFLLTSLLLLSSVSAQADVYQDVNRLIGAAEWSKAQAQAQEYLKTRPTDPQMRLLLSRIQDGQGQTAEAMASGARVALTQVPSIDAKKVIGISTTGVAGPELQEGKAVGTVFVGLALDAAVSSRQLALSGDRETIRTETVRAALLALLEEIAG